MNEEPETDERGNPVEEDAEAVGSDEVLSVHAAQRIPASRALRDPVLFLATGLCSGCVGVAPGTVGSLVALILWIPVALFVPDGVQWLLVAVAILAGALLCHEAARRLEVHDHPAIVWDEFAGMWLALIIGQPAGILGWALAFALFRLFDVTKPWPLSWFDHNLKGGSGIMADDVLAGALAGGILLAAASWWPGLI